MNERIMEFAIFCIENIATKLNIDPQKVYDLLSKDSNILENYIVPEYELDESIFDILHMKQVDSYPEEWLDFIMACRRQEDRSSYDIVIGGIANDKVFNTLELYFDQLIDKSEAIKRLQYEKPNLQIAFRIDRALDVFYHSITYELMRDGIGDTHCMSDSYLVTDILEELNEKAS